MNDPFSILIDKSVLYSKTEYYSLLFKTKRKFFEYLKEKKSFNEFKKEMSNIWDNVDHKYMSDTIEKLQNMLKENELNGHKILNPNAVYQEIFNIPSESDFKTVEKKFKEYIEKYYKEKLKTVEKDYIEEDKYLSELVDTYEQIEEIIPYYNKDGTVRSHHNIASYNSMLYNTALTKSGWNRTMYDANLLDRDLLYLPAHTFACELCMPWQGRVYSKNGLTPGYPKQQDAIDGGVGHPNCRHQWTIYWDKSQIQENKYDNSEWEEAYIIKQKIRSLQLELNKLENDRIIYQKLNQNGKVDKINLRIKKINSTIEELNKTID